MFLRQQERSFGSLLSRLNLLHAQKPFGKVAEAFERDERAAGLHDLLVNLSEGVGKELPGDVPQYRADLLDGSPREIIQFQIGQKKAIHHYFFDVRDLLGVRALHRYAPRAGNTAFCMGYIHMINTVLNVDSSSIIVHPIPRDHKLRQKFDPEIKAILKSTGAPIFDFLKGAQR